MTAVEAAIATLLLFGVALMWGSKDSDVGAISVIGLTWFLTFDIGWVQPTMGGAAFTLVLASLFVLAVLNYMKKREARLV